MSVLAKYDIRGIQSYVFRTNKLREIRAVQDLPEKIVFAALKNAAGIPETTDESAAMQELAGKGIQVLDKAGGNAIVIFQSKVQYQEISKQMAFWILQQTHSLHLVYACVECTDDFYDDYKKLNQLLGTRKSAMPEACHMGAFPICRQDRVTGFPLAGKDGFGEYTTKESLLKMGYMTRTSTSKQENTIDNYVLAKGVDSHIAVIHIDGNNMGNRINSVISSASYDNATEVFRSIRVRDRFAEVCQEMQEYVREYQSSNPEGRQYLIHAVIQAGDDITYLTRADIAFSFTKEFLKRISEKFMLAGTQEDRYRISACAGIAYCHSHFPFSDAYVLAEKCCANAKKRAKENKHPTSGYIGNWVDFEICGHIRDVDIVQSRKRYGVVDGTMLHMRPYCVAHPQYTDPEHDFEVFEEHLRSLTKEKPIVNRSRAKALRQAYMDGRNAVTVWQKAAISRGYDKIPEKLYRNGCAVLYDAVEMMDLYTDMNKGGEEK